MCAPEPRAAWVCVGCNKLCEATDIGMDFGYRVVPSARFDRGYCKPCLAKVQAPLFSDVAFTPQSSED